MPEKILGLDISEGMLKAVLVSRGMRGGYRVELAEQIDVSAAGGAAEALQQLQAKVDFQQVAVKMSLPPGLVSFHNVKLPFREEKKIRQTIGFELETMLPHGIDDYLLDYNIISLTDHAEILAGVVPRAVVQERIAFFGDSPPEISVVTLGAVAEAAWLSANRAIPEPVLLLQVGDRESSAVFLRQGKILQVRRYTFGEELRRDEESATGPSGTGGATNAGPVSADRAPEEGLSDQFCHELTNTIEFLKWGGILEEKISRIFLTGSGALDQALQERLAGFFAVPVEALDLAQTDGLLLAEEMQKSWQPALMNQALAVALYQHKQGQGFNFPLTELAKAARREELGHTLKWGAVIFAVALLLVAVDNYLDYRYARLSLDNLKKEISTVFRTAAPEVTRVVDPVSQFKAKIGETKKISAGIRGMEGSATVLDILKDISALAPPVTEFLITAFNLDEDRLVIKGTAKNFDAVDTLKREFAKSKYLKSVQIGTTSQVKQGDKVEFDLRMTTQR